MLLTHARLITIWLISLLLMLLAHRLNAQALKTNSYYFELEINGSTNDVFIRGYNSPTAVFSLTHDKNIVSFYISTIGRIQDDDFFTLDYWFGETNAVLVPDLPRFLPYVPPQRTPEQLAAASLMASNRVWKASHPSITPAQPKAGNKPVVVPAKAVGPPAMP